MPKFTVIIENKSTGLIEHLPIENANILLEQEDNYRIYGFNGFPGVDKLSLEEVIYLDQMFKNKPEHIEDDLIQTLLSKYGVQRYQYVKKLLLGISTDSHKKNP